MATPRILTDVPPGRLHLLLALIERDGGTAVHERQLDGRFTVTASLPGAPAPIAEPAPGSDEFEWMTVARAEIGPTRAVVGRDDPRIVDYQAKWDDQSFAYHHTSRTFDFPPDDQPLLNELARVARACWHVFGLAGYARIDFRLDKAGRPWILEVNANPCLSPDAGFAAAVDRARVGFDRAVERIVADALRRAPRKPIAHV